MSKNEKEETASDKKNSWLDDYYNRNKLWLQGYYPPDIDKRGRFARWSAAWSLVPSEDGSWVWFNGGYYTEEEAREVLRKKELLKSDENENEELE